MTLLTDAPDVPITGLWSLLGVIVTTIIAPIVVAVVTWRTSRPRIIEPSPERQAVEAGLGVSTKGVPDESITVFARLYGDIAALRTELGLEIHYSDLLEEHADAMDEWGDDAEEGAAAGRYPPFPDRPVRPTRSGSTRL